MIIKVNLSPFLYSLDYRKNKLFVLVHICISKSACESEYCTYKVQYEGWRRVEEGAMEHGFMPLMAIV
jgi:hypothetical protein